MRPGPLTGLAAAALLAGAALPAGAAVEREDILVLDADGRHWCLEVNPSPGSTVGPTALSPRVRVVSDS